MLSALKQNKTKREEGVLKNQKHFKQVSNLMFYAQLTSTFISGLHFEQNEKREDKNSNTWTNIVFLNGKKVNKRMPKLHPKTPAPDVSVMQNTPHQV